jgi:hypothetical protein
MYTVLANPIYNSVHMALFAGIPSNVRSYMAYNMVLANSTYKTRLHVSTLGMQLVHNVVQTATAPPLHLCEPALSPSSCPRSEWFHRATPKWLPARLEPCRPTTPRWCGLHVRRHVCACVCVCVCARAHTCMCVYMSVCYCAFQCVHCNHCWLIMYHVSMCEY